MERRVFVFGNAAWDETLYLAALPAQGASVHVRRGPEGLGGKGANQAVVLSRAGVPVTLVAALGQDARGDAVASALASEALRSVLVRLSCATDWSVVLVAGAAENAILTTREAALALSPEVLRAALAGAGPGDLCLVQGNLSVATTRAAVDAAKALGMAVAFNPSPVDPAFAGLFENVDVLFLNRNEAAAYGAIVSAAGAVVETLGAEGARMSGRDGEVRIAAAPTTAIDPTGAGDAFLGAALAVARGRAWRIDCDALTAGARAAALVVGRAGAFPAMPTRDEMAAIIAAP